MAFGGTLPAMPKDSPKRVAVKAEDATVKRPDIPPEIAQLIDERSVRIDPDRYFSKELRAKLPLIQHRLKESSRNTFTVEPELFEDFISALRQVLEKKGDPGYADFKPSDWISWVLGIVATNKEMDESPFDDPPEGYWEPISLPSNLTAPGDRPESTAKPGSTQPDSNTVSLNVAFNYAADWSVSIEISIAGEPLSTFLDLETGGEMTPTERRALQRRAKAIWNLLSDKISSRLGIQQLQRGRSLTNRGKMAAMLHDHFGYSWAKLAQGLCKDEACKDEKGHWKHSHWCRERYRKLAALYWKREAAKYAAMARDRKTP
jgi:hypothetical protein